MIKTTKILPGTGRGTARSVVEGALGLERRVRTGTPSVSPAGCHLPASEEDRA